MRSVATLSLARPAIVSYWLLRLLPGITGPAWDSIQLKGAYGPVIWMPFGTPLLLPSALWPLENAWSEGQQPDPPP
jgi:hypothetical protein